jgi:hypothetical protein
MRQAAGATQRLYGLKKRDMLATVLELVWCQPQHGDFTHSFKCVQEPNGIKLRPRQSQDREVIEW